MDEQKDLTEQAAEEASAEGADSRRAFINKLVAAAGTFAVAEMLSGSDAFAATKKAALEEVGANTGIANPVQSGALQAIKIDAQKIDKLSPQSLGGVRSRDAGAGVGFVVSLHGKALGEALVRAGVLPADANLENAKLTIEFSA